MDMENIGPSLKMLGATGNFRFKRKFNNVLPLLGFRWIYTIRQIQVIKLFHSFHSDFVPEFYKNVKSRGNVKGGDGIPQRPNGPF